MKNRKSILHLTSEVSPFYKRGGLGDVVGSLPQYLSKEYRNCVISFYYNGRMKGLEEAQKYQFSMPVHGVEYGFYYYKLVRDGVHYFFIDMEDENVLADSEGGSGGSQKGKGSTAYVEVLPMSTHFYFAKAALRLIELEDVQPLHILLHDWHVCGIFGYEKMLDNLRRRYDSKTTIMIHNFEYKGALLPDSFPFMDPDCRPVLEALYQKHRSASLLGLGIEKADHVATVSKGYARELEQGLAPHIGYKFLEARPDGVLDFTNGVDYSLWHPQNSPFLPTPYNWESIERKKQYKKDMIEQFGFDDTDEPICLFMARLTPQKGISLLMNFAASDEEGLAQIEKALDSGLRLVVYGTPSNGENDRMHHLFSLARKHFPKRFYYDGKYTEVKAHRYLAGADMLLSPSYFEPCGLVQLYAMAFGTVPLVNPVGGLGHTVDCYRKEPENATGFHLRSYTSESLNECMRLAGQIYNEQADRWQELVQEGMERDFSWEKMTQKYLTFFEADMVIQV
ncbi:MAG: glycogen/starch synthase [Bacteroidota bacterium]